MAKFTKGVSGNPSGRPAVDPGIKIALAAMTPRAVERLAELLESTDEKIAAMALKEVLDRNLGKSMQPTESKVEVKTEASWDLSKLSDEELRVMKALALKATARAKPTAD